MGVLGVVGEQADVRLRSCLCFCHTAVLAVAAPCNLGHVVDQSSPRNGDSIQTVYLASILFGKMTGTRGCSPRQDADINDYGYIDSSCRISLPHVSSLYVINYGIGEVVAQWHYLPIVSLRRVVSVRYHPPSSHHDCSVLPVCPLLVILMMPIIRV